jgi:hypothetical protein
MSFRSLASRRSPGWRPLLLLLSGCQAEIAGPVAEAPVGGAGAQQGSGAVGAGGASSGSAGAGATTGGAGATGGSASGAGGTTAGAGGAGAAPADCAEPRAATLGLRLLTGSQYDNSVLDIVGVSGNPAQGFGSGLDDIVLEQRASVAARVATEAAANLAAWAPCTPSADDPQTCARQIVDEIGARLYRHPLSDAERAELSALFDAGVAERDFALGVEWFLKGVLQAPDFMYEVVRPGTAEIPGEVRALSPHEYASRLAYFIWDGPPDAALTAAASSDALTDPVTRDAEIARMLADPRFSRGLAQFYTSWLGMKGFDEIARDVAEFDQSVVDSLAISLLLSATKLYESPAPNITQLFSGDSYYLNDVLRGFYGLPGTGTDFVATPMPGESRQGILTHPAMMALFARPGESFPIGRGLHLLRTILCEVIPAPDGIEIPPLPPFQEGVSTRERLETHTSSPICLGCHSLINPAGFAFESFDEVGRFRTLDHGRPVDTSGMLELNKDIDGAFATGSELLSKLGTSQAVRACFAEKYLDFAVARMVTHEADKCSVQKLTESFGPSGDLKQLIVSVAASDSFRMRLAEGVGQ